MGEEESMFNQEMIDNIREGGIAQGATEVEKRAALLQELGFRMADRAEYALIASCYLPTLSTEDMRAFSHLLRHFEVDYTLLRQEYCCGNLLLRQALKDKTGEMLSQADLLAQEFLENNLRQIREVGARKIVAFCVGCDGVYSRLKDAVPEEILWYPTLLARLFRGGKLELQADYYAGCHYYYRRWGGAPDLDSALQVMGRIEGLQLNHLDQRLCCTRPEERERLLDTVQNRIIITVCSGCSMYLQQALQDKGDYKVVMLPQVAWAAINGHTL